MVSGFIPRVFVQVINKMVFFQLCLFVVVHFTSQMEADHVDFEVRVPLELVCLGVNAKTSECGLYSLAAIMIANNRSLDLTGIFQRSNVDLGVYGTSSRKLATYLQNQGLFCSTIERLPAQTLKILDSSCILLFDEADGPVRHGHWVAFLGMNGDRFVIFDVGNPRNVYELSSGELQLRWQGFAIVVNDNPFNRWYVSICCITQNCILVIRITSVAVLFWLTSKLLVRMHARSWFLPKLFRIIAVLLVGTSCYFSSDSIIGNRPVVNWVAGRYSKKIPPEISLGSIVELISSPSNSVVFVDARSQLDFERNRIPGTINIPANTTPEDFYRRAASLPKSTQIVVFCDNEFCSYADFVAGLLLATGKSHVAVFRPGIYRLSVELSGQRSLAPTPGNDRP